MSKGSALDPNKLSPPTGSIFTPKPRYASLDPATERVRPLQQSVKKAAERGGRRKNQRMHHTQYNTFEIDKPFVNPGHTGFNTSFYAKKFIL